MQVRPALQTLRQPAATNYLQVARFLPDDPNPQIVQITATQLVLYSHTLQPLRTFALYEIFPSPLLTLCVISSKDFPSLHNDILFTLDAQLTIRTHNFGTHHTHVYDTASELPQGVQPKL